MSRRHFLSLLPASVALGATLALLPGCTRAALTPRGARPSGSPGHDQTPLRIGELEHFTARQLLPLTLWLGTGPDARRSVNERVAELERRKDVLNACLWLSATRSADAPAHFFDHPQSAYVSAGLGQPAGTAGGRHAALLVGGRFARGVGLRQDTLLARGERRTSRP